MGDGTQDQASFKENKLSIIDSNPLPEQRCENCREYEFLSERKGFCSKVLLKLRLDNLCLVGQKCFVVDKGFCCEMFNPIRHE